MPRLFVAADLPSNSVAELLRIQPAPAQGVRPSQQSQMHLTLHFLGETDVDDAKTALNSVAIPAFSLTFEGVGQFTTVDGGLILWAGVRKSDELQRLHAVIGEALAVIGYHPEARPYSPHITLARCARRRANGIVENFMAQQRDFQLRDQPITTFGLYSSTVVGQVRTYRCEQSFPLIPRSHDAETGAE
jgi:2'-5' RNA ligase